jgi:hypothetical protein
VSPQARAATVLAGGLVAFALVAAAAVVRFGPVGIAMVIVTGWLIVAALSNAGAR